VLAQAAVALAARIKHRYDCGDHTLFVGEVQDLTVNEAAPPLLFYEGRYGLLQAARQPSGRTAEPYPSFF
jgi:flavin reductase (DIM6/NTAB) family NADH-FMN oxidoreductase RutF